MKASEERCPSCASDAIELVRWKEKPDGARPGDPDVAVVVVPLAPVEEPDGPNRLCAACGRQFCSDPLQQERYDAQLRHERARSAAIKHGAYLWFEAHNVAHDAADGSSRAKPSPPDDDARCERGE